MLKNKSNDLKLGATKRNDSIYIDDDDDDDFGCTNAVNSKKTEILDDIIEINDDDEDDQLNKWFVNDTCQPKTNSRDFNKPNSMSYEQSKPKGALPIVSKFSKISSNIETSLFVNNVRIILIISTQYYCFKIFQLNKINFSQKSFQIG
jgi:hypothetical protein